MNKTSRRGFLKTVGIASAAPATVPGSVLADRNKKTQRRTSFAPNRDLKKLSENLYLLRTPATSTWCVTVAEAC